MFNINIDERLFQLGTPKKLTFKGQTKEFPTRRIPLNLLYLNDMNGRIATMISKWISEGNDLQTLTLTEYNFLISRFIREVNNEARYKKTKEDIRKNTQREAGVVLTDGRVIDGNRRFTCLLDLYAETGDSQFGFFEAVVLPTPITDTDKKAIKSLELELQIGIDEKVGYGPIDRLVDAYRDLIKDQLFNEQEYRKETNLSVAAFKKLKGKAEIMADFLSFFNRPEEFYLAKELEIDGPLEEIYGFRRKVDSEAEWNRVKPVFYQYLWTVRKGDRTRDIRHLCKLYITNNDAFEELLDKHVELSVRIQGVEESRSQGASQQEISTELETIGEDAHQAFVAVDVDENLAEAKMRPIKDANKSLETLQSIDFDIVEHYSPEEKENLVNVLAFISSSIEEMIKKVNGKPGK